MTAIKSRDLFVRKLYMHKRVGVVVEIDYLKKQVSLVEPFGNQTNFQPKK